MEIVSCTHIDVTAYERDYHPYVWALHVQINHADFPQEARRIVDILSDNCWLSKLDEIDQAAYSERMQDTLDNIVADIENGSRAGASKAMVKVFMEYLISVNAQRALIEKEHGEIPLAELWKEKASGNPGFDFHTISPHQMLVFGEAKYTKNGSPYSNAISQVVKFIKRKKHTKELSDLRRFALKPVKKVLKGQFGVAAAFSVKAGKAAHRIEQTIRHNAFKELLANKEVYILAVEIV